MSITRIYVTELGQCVPEGWDACFVGEHLKFKESALETYFFKNREDVVYDAFVLMAAVEYCDYIKQRVTRGWGRKFVLSVPVDDPLHWNDEKVRQPLISSLNILTGDFWNIKFHKRDFVPDWPSQGEFPIETNPLAVMAYSNGLDSLSVSGILSEEFGDKLVRIRLGGKAKNKKHPFVAIPYQVHPNVYKKESSGRSRGFKFAVLSASSAYLSGASRIIVPESGQGSLGPAFVPLGRIPIDYRNHPKFFSKMEQFLFALFGKELSFEIPRLWYTKGQTIAHYIKRSNDDKSWRETVSCWRGSQQTSVNREKRQCGICAACLLRRLSVHAAGLEESNDTYLWHDLSVSDFAKGAARDVDKMHDFGAHKKYAIAGMGHLRDMAEISHLGLSPSLNLHASELARIQNIEKKVIMSNQIELLSNHAQEWEAFLTSLGEKSFLVKWARRRK